MERESAAPSGEEAYDIGALHNRRVLFPLPVGESRFSGVRPSSGNATRIWRHIFEGFCERRRDFRTGARKAIVNDAEHAAH